MSLCDRLEKVGVNRFDLARECRGQKRGHHDHNDLDKITRDFA